MRVGQFTANGSDSAWTGVVRDDDRIVNIEEAGQAAGLDLDGGLRELLSEYCWREKTDIAVAYAEETGEALYDMEEVSHLAPIRNPEKVICVGLNYSDHAAESDNEVPENPILFSKFPTAVTGPFDTIKWDPDLTQKVDYEAELAVVIGRQARRVSKDEARSYVAGYTVGNDVSARDLQLGDEQWVRGKSLDTFAPLGPEMVTTDELDDTSDLSIWAERNGTRLQDSSTRHLIFDIDELVSFCSQAFTLNPGDVIFTGTPDGVGIFRDPPILLEEGDEISIGVEGIGEITNDCAYK